MKGTKVYPENGYANRLICGLLLVTAFAIAVSGLFHNEQAKEFLVETVPETTPNLLNEAFDDTVSETVIELAASNWYSLQTGVFEEEGRAIESAQVFQKRGAAGFVWNEGRFRVLAAVYSLKEDAQRVRQQLRFLQ